MKTLHNTICTIISIVCLANTGCCNSTKNKVEKTITQTGEKIKATAHKAADALSKEKVHESIDQVADYFDKEKLKEGVDQAAEYFDKEKLKDYIDYIADHLDRDQIKGMIDLVADALDRDKVKEAADQVLGSFDKDQIKEQIDESVDKITASLNETVQSLEKELSQLGNNKNGIQTALKKYNWNKWLPDQAVYGPATLSNLKLGGMKKVVLAKPNQNIEGEVLCSLDRKQCSALGVYRVVLGIKGGSGQTTIFNHFGIRGGKETDHFTLTAPAKKGVYQVAFQVVEAAREGTALQAWDESWEEPKVIGLIIVS